jgi:hypothetical protein
MTTRPLRIALVAALLLSASVAQAQYNDHAGENVITEPTPVPRETDSGDIEWLMEERPVVTDTYGNPQGNQYDLAIDGAFEGQTVAVLHFYTLESNFDFALPEAALREKGFGVYRWIGGAPEPEDLRRALANSCQLWIISDSARFLTEEHLDIIENFFNSGRGVYIWGDNDPYYSDANAVAERLLGMTMYGNLPGGQAVGVQTAENTAGVAPGHLITTGLEHLFEGITIATINVPTDMEGITPIIYGSANNLVAVAYERDGRRAIFDGGFTRLYNGWDTAGTARYVKNAAAWLAHWERFGDEVLAPELQEGN